MTENTPPEDEDVTHQHIMDQLMPLRDRIVKIETIVDYHDKEFQNVKNSITDLNKTIDRNAGQIMDKLEHHNKTFMDMSYEQIRDNAENNAVIVKSIETNKNTFDNWVSKWRAVSWAVWFTISVALTAVGWGISTMHDLGFFEIVQQTSAQIKSQSESNL